MKKDRIICDIENINNENQADVYHKGIYIGNWLFGNGILLYEETKENHVSIKQLAQLKEAGFDSDEIIKMKKEGLL